MIFFRKITLKNDMAGIIEKDDIHPRTYVISSDKKIKDNKKVYFNQNVSVILFTFMETFIGVFIYCFLMKKTKTKKPRKLVCRTEIETPSFSCAWRHPTMKNVQYTVPFSPQQFYLRVCLSAS